MNNYKLYKAFGEEKTLTDFCKQYKIKKESVNSRLNRGMSLEDALKTPLKIHRYKPTDFEIGKIYNDSAKLINPIGYDKDGHYYCDFECLLNLPNCKKYFKARFKHVLAGNISSCGCLKNVRGINHRDWKGCGDISGSVFCRIQLGCKRKNRTLEFAITIQEIWDLFLKQDRKCALSGEILKFNSNYKMFDGTASLDRIDSDKGYIPGNVQWVHKDLQTMKMDSSDEKFINWCHKVSNHNK